MPPEPVERERHAEQPECSALLERKFRQRGVRVVLSEEQQRQAVLHSVGIREALQGFLQDLNPSRRGGTAPMTI